MQNVIGQVGGKEAKISKLTALSYKLIFTESIIIVNDIGMIVSILRPY